MQLKYYCDTERHLVCVPYSIENLHLMAEDLNIDKCFFHLKNKRGKLNPHYDIPQRRIKEISDKCIIINKREILEIIKTQRQ